MQSLFLDLFLPVFWALQINCIHAKYFFYDLDKYHPGCDISRIKIAAQEAPNDVPLGAVS
jgi:hypothetical protein